jgi:hypothetical protein
LIDDEKGITTNVGIVMPPDFPVKTYNEVLKYINKYNTSKKEEWTLFHMGWNGLRYRYRAMADYDEQFTSSVKKSNSSSHEERYIQENALFGFFVSGVSAIECLFFSIYCMASFINTKSFPVMKANELRFDPENVTTRFNISFPNDALSSCMTNFQANPKWTDLNDFRNVLSHRGVPPRTFYAGGERDGMATIPINPKEPSHIWKYDFYINENTTSSYRHWLSKELTNLLNNVETFCKSKL